MARSVAAVPDVLADPAAFVRALPDALAGRLFMELFLHLFAPKPPVAVAPTGPGKRLTMQEAAEYIRMPYVTFSRRWPSVPLLKAAHFGDSGTRHFFLSTGLDAYLEQRGAVTRPARRGLGR